ncbi:MAG: alpha-amylase/4-alpha-glucanotransferase domain-containing protein [Candidatus Aminicenantales bacterium]
MPELTFLFAVHNHQPVGNFPEVFKKAFRDCYEPFLAEMAAHPAVRFTLHFSGPLWEYMAAKEKKSWELVEEMAARGQVELLGGGFYEPILSIIPEEDRVGQLRLMNNFLNENFGRRPRGGWLTERVWEPHLPKILAGEGIEYTILDEEHFHYAGISDIERPYITEEEGSPLVLFPVSKPLRYDIPFHLLEEVRLRFREIKERGGVAILGDDGEKFGLWPGTHKWVYEEGWLAAFLTFLENEGIRTMTYSSYLDDRPPLGKVYIPPASYEEMMEWVLEPEDYDRFRALKQQVSVEKRRFLRGGFFREFFLKYPESNHLHKRMLLVSREVRKSRNPEASRDLYKAQCNDPFWHGIFGGLYLPHLRESAYRHLLSAEKNLPLQPGWETVDYDLDGREELVFRQDNLNLLLKPSFGGSLIEFDDRRLGRNLSDVLSRREESYHRHREEESGGEGKSIHELAKKLPPEASSLLRYDWYPRFSLLDHFLHPGTTAESFRQVDYGEQGDFVNQEYQFALQEDSALMVRHGHVWAGGERLPVRVAKRLAPAKDRVLISYELENESDRELQALFAVEWNFYLLEKEWEVRQGTLSLLSGEWRLEFSPVPGIWHFPLQTLSQSEEGYDIIHQGMCFLSHWEVGLARRQKFSLSITLKGNKGYER